MKPLRLVILICLSAVLFSMSKKATTPRPTPAPTAYPQTTPVPGKLVFHPLKGYATEQEKALIAQAQDAANRTIQGDCFRNWMSSQKMNNTNGRTAAQVAAHLQGLSGEIVVRMYYRSLKETSALASAYVGGMIVGSGRVHQVMLNSAYFTGAQTPCRWAATLGGHEGLGHSMGGYGHSQEWTRSREDTIPYLLSGRKQVYGGDVFGACCK